MNSTHIWVGRWSDQSVLPPDTRIKIAAWYWRERYWLSMHNKGKSEPLAVISTKRVAIFQGNLKLVREGSDPKTLRVRINDQHPMDQNVYMKEDAVIKMAHSFKYDRLTWSHVMTMRFQKGWNSRTISTNWAQSQSKPKYVNQKKSANLGMDKAFFGTSFWAHQPAHFVIDDWVATAWQTEEENPCLSNTSLSCQQVKCSDGRSWSIWSPKHPWWVFYDRKTMRNIFQHVQNCGKTWCLHPTKSHQNRKFVFTCDMLSEIWTECGN